MRRLLIVVVVLLSASFPTRAKPEPAPPWIEMARSQLGVSERSDSGRRKIRQYHKHGSQRALSAKTAWCASFMNWVLKRSGHRGTNSAMARSFESLGTRLKKPRPGCIVVFWRKSKTSGLGHVGIWLGESGASVQVLGGNQSNEVRVSNYPKARVTAYVWPRRWGPF